VPDRSPFATAGKRSDHVTYCRAADTYGAFMEMPSSEFAAQLLDRSSSECQVLAGQLLDGPVQQLTALSLSVSAAAATVPAGSAAQHWLQTRAELIGRYARLLAATADKLEHIEEAPVRRRRLH
jgi:hypothetical protein